MLVYCRFVLLLLLKRKKILKIVRMKTIKNGLGEGKENCLMEEDLMRNPIQSKLSRSRLYRCVGKFGQSIKAKALNPRDDNQSTKLEQRSICRQSVIMDHDHHLTDKARKKMSSSFTIHANTNRRQSEEPGRNCHRRKSVRFTEADSDELSATKSVRKSSSILRNSISSDVPMNPMQKMSTCSMNSHLGSFSTKVDPSNNNNKYHKSLKQLQSSNKKYFDELFPPGDASLFYNKPNKHKYENVKWVRVNEIFAGQKLLLYSEEDRSLVLNGAFPEFEYMATCFNALATSYQVIERIFQKQFYSLYGIYYLRINHQGIIKYLIVDDYIPAIRKGKSYEPVFCNVRLSKSQYVELWPFLLQKAFAKIYGCYEALQNQHIDNFMQQITGIIPHAIGFDHPSYQISISRAFMNPNHIILGKSKQFNELTPYCPLYQQQQFSCFQPSPNLKLLSSTSSIDLQISSLPILLDNVLVYESDESFCSTGCRVKQTQKGISLRKFTLEVATECKLSLIQKDRKYYRNCEYSYVWARLILLMKDIDGWRWVNGTYSQGKIVHLHSVLNPGQYCVVTMADWVDKIYQFTLNYYGSSPIEFERESLNKHPRLLEQLGTDLAQRFSSCKQITKQLCSYQYVDKQNGLIIENINNESEKSVFYRKHYKKKNNILSIGTGLKDNHRLEVSIAKNSSVTVIFRMRNGISEDNINFFTHQ